MKNPVTKHFNKFNRPSVISDKREKLAEEAETMYSDLEIYEEPEDVDIGCSSINID